MTSLKFLRTENIDNLKFKSYVISLFTGIGGMDLGFRQAGFEIRVMVEWEKNACETLRANWTRKGWGNREPIPNWMQEREPVILERDLTKTSTEEILKAGDLKVGEAGVLIGGFPCQGFSTAGKRMMDDPRNVLYKECVRVIKEALPKCFVLENVPGLISMGKGTIIDQICKDLASAGYKVNWQKLNAADYGVPQNRIRVFFIGYRIDTFVFLEKGNPALCMGCPGSYTHPDWFEKKYKIKSSNFYI